MRLLHVTPAYHPATYWGGPIYSTYALCNALVDMGPVHLKVLTSNSAGPRLSDEVKTDGTPTYIGRGYEVFYCRRAMGMSFSPEMFTYLTGMVRWAEIVHLTGVYSA